MMDDATIAAPLAIRPSIILHIASDSNMV